jgi:hypothetical protein
MDRMQLKNTMEKCNKSNPKEFVFRVKKLRKSGNMYKYVFV